MVNIWKSAWDECSLFHLYKVQSIWVYFSNNGHLNMASFFHVMSSLTLSFIEIGGSGRGKAYALS